MKKAGGGKLMSQAWKGPSDTKAVPAKNSGGKDAPAALKKAWGDQSQRSQAVKVGGAKEKVR